MQEKKRRIPGELVALLIVLVSALFIAAGFYWVGAFYRDDGRIYPNIYISGVNVSWLTRDEAVDLFNAADLDRRADNAKVTIIFPDSSELTVKGEDIGLTNSIRSTVESAYSVGRGRGFIKDTMSFIGRLFGNDIIYIADHEYNLESMHVTVTEFVDEYNAGLVSAKPHVYNDKVVFTKGAGRALAEPVIVKDLVYIGLFESFNTYETVEKEYVLPDSPTDIETLLAVHDSMAVAVKSAEFDTETWLVEDCVVGIDFDLFDAVALLNDTRSGKTATVYVDFIQPELTREYLESLLFRDLLGTETTHVAGTSDRVTNVRLSSEAINGLILGPGEEFSFNGVVGVRSSSRGYRPGGAFVGGETVSVIGGGICQTSSTLYSAIMDTDIKVTERYPHGQRVPYLPRGRDATVFWNRLDFRFENNTEYPMRIEFELENRSLTVWVYGTIIDDFPRVPFESQAGAAGE